MTDLINMTKAAINALLAAPGTSSSSNHRALLPSSSANGRMAEDQWGLGAVIGLAGV